MGFETFPAKWSKAGLELDMLTPVIGKPGSFNSCRMKVELKDSVFIFRNRQLMAVPIATYKAWMVLHQYDPEHGMNDPILTAPAPGATGVNGVPLVPAQASPAPAPKPIWIRHGDGRSARTLRKCVRSALLKYSARSLRCPGPR